MTQAPGDLAAEVAGVAENRSNRGGGPYAGRSRVARCSRFARAGYSIAFKGSCDGTEPHAVVEHLEDALHDRRSFKVGFQRSQLCPRGCFASVRVREAGIDETVAVVGAAAEPATIRPTVGLLTPRM